jgi:hypothetical protein
MLLKRYFKDIFINRLTAGLAGIRSLFDHSGRFSIKNGFILQYSETETEAAAIRRPFQFLNSAFKIHSFTKLIHSSVVSFAGRITITCLSTGFLHFGQFFSTDSLTVPFGPVRQNQTGGGMQAQKGESSMIVASNFLSLFLILIYSNPRRIESGINFRLPGIPDIYG